MKKERILKMFLIMVISIAFVMVSTNVFAVGLLDDEELENDDLTNSINENTNTNSNSNSNTNSQQPNTNVNNSNTNKNSNSNSNRNSNSNSNENTNTNNYNTNLPKTGLAENTLLGVGLTVLAVVSIIAYNRFSYYKNV